MCKMLLKVGSRSFIHRVFVNFRFVTCSFVPVFLRVFYNCVLLMLVGDRTGPHATSMPWLRRKEIFLTEVVNPVKWRHVIAEPSWVDYISGSVLCSNNVMLRFLEIKKHPFNNIGLSGDNSKSEIKFHISDRHNTLWKSKCWQANVLNYC